MNHPVTRGYSIHHRDCLRCHRDRCRPLTGAPTQPSLTHQKAGNCGGQPIPHLTAGQRSSPASRWGDCAVAYRAAGRTSDGIERHARNLTDSEQVLGLEHHDTLTTRNNLALDYQVAGRIGEAIELHEQILTDCEQALGALHPHALVTQPDLAAVCRAVGWIGEAVELHERTHTASKSWPPRHPYCPQQSYAGA
ncbi:tetratricopeptide repeat protein [Nocardia sp. NPDC019255]|uniref:tetratricopeptide repeat protein n=1 Tax=Nocardia sp. NPDC019255 TaxID=3154591 RepID=UPI0033C8EF67